MGRWKITTKDEKERIMSEIIGNKIKEQAVKKVVEAQEFVLKDESGKVRARLGLSKGQPYLSMFDDSGCPSIELGITPVLNGSLPRLVIRHPQSDAMVVLSSNAHGSAGLWLCDGGQANIGSFSVYDSGVDLSMYSPDGEDAEVHFGTTPASMRMDFEGDGENASWRSSPTR
jgi:hypothetical protein